MRYKMKTKNVVAGILAVFVVCMLFCGAVAAFEVTTPGKTDPSGSLVPNESVSGYMQILIPANTLGDGDKIYFETDLTNATWSVSVGTKGGTPLLTKNPQYPNNFITGYDVNYGDSDIVVDISINGSVFSGDAGTDIRALVVRATKYEKTGVGEASTPVQRVYDPDNIPSDINALKNEIDYQDGRIAFYISYGWDVSKAQSKLEQARSKLNEAKNISDPRSASVTLETARNLLIEAERELALSSLSLTLSYTTYVDTIVDKLYSKGWNSEAMLLETKNTALVNTYNQLYATYTAGNVPDAASLDKLAADSIALYADALVYEEAADNPLGGLLNYLPFILIGLGAAAIIVVIVVVIVKKRKNSWDELG